MTLDEMKKIAEARTKGEWWPSGQEVEDSFCGRSPYAKKQQGKKDAKFIAMAANKWDKLMAVVEAAHNLRNDIKRSVCLDTDFTGSAISTVVEGKNLYVFVNALKALEEP